jgi:predicted regulator of Ras-like GTPase activity (Roadblock/LC7/MglB family)
VKAKTYRKLVARKLQEDALKLQEALPNPTSFNTPSSAIMAYSKNSPAGQAIDAIITDLPGLVAVAVVDVQSGMALASHSNSPSINPETAAAYNTEVVKQKQKAMSALKLQGETIEDILITLTNQLHLLKLNPAGTKFIYLVVNSRDTNLAIAREVLRSHVGGIN